MEYVEGQTLADLILSQGPLPIEQAVSIARSVAAGLDGAQRLGVVHRDIKPQNIMVSHDGAVKVTDFGIARAAGQTSMTATGVFLGTPSYMAPEVSTSGQADTRSDIYSLGVVLFEMLTGKVPFSAGTPWAVIRQHERTTPPSLSEFRPDVPAWLAGVYETCLAKRPRERYRTAHDLFLALSETPATRILAQDAARPRGRLVLLGAAGGLFMVLAVFAAAVFNSPGYSEFPGGPEARADVPTESPESTPEQGATQEDATATPSPATDSTVTSGDSYTVVAGDTLASICTRMKPASMSVSDCVDLILSLNNLSDSRLISVGDRLKLPGVTAQPLPDRQECVAIQGTEYRSQAEGEWYRANCIVPTPIAPAATAFPANGPVIRSLECDSSLGSVSKPGGGVLRVSASSNVVHCIAVLSTAYEKIQWLNGPTIESATQPCGCGGQSLTLNVRWGSEHNWVIVFQVTLNGISRVESIDLMLVD
jgi:LysM repeat protein